jgi:hypothetical protein
VKKIILRFDEWLVDQQLREDFVGDLARVPSMQGIEHKISTRKVDEHKNWTEIVIKIAEPGYIAIFNEAWQEFLLAKQLANDSPD